MPGYLVRMGGMRAARLGGECQEITLIAVVSTSAGLACEPVHYLVKVLRVNKWWGI